MIKVGLKIRLQECNLFFLQMHFTISTPKTYKIYTFNLFLQI